GAVALLAGDPLVIVEEIAAAVEDQVTSVYLQALDVVGRMAMNYVNARPVDQAMSKGDLIFGDLISPVATPVDRDDDEMASAGLTRDRFGDLLDRTIGEIGQEVHPGRPRRRSPLGGYTARRGAEGEDKDPPLSPNVKHGWCRRLLGVPSRADVLDARILQ